MSTSSALRVVTEPVILRQHFRFVVGAKIRWENRRWEVVGGVCEPGMPDRYYYQIVPSPNPTGEVQLVRNFILHAEAKGCTRRKRPVSGFWGVAQTRKGRFSASTSINNKRVYIGTYDTRTDAARAIDEYMRRHGAPPHWEFNFPEGATP